MRYLENEMVIERVDNGFVVRTKHSNQVYHRDEKHLVVASVKGFIGAPIDDGALETSTSGSDH